MNDSTTIYISHSDDMSNHQGVSSIDSATNTALSKKVAQNRAAQKSFRQRKQLYVEDLENKARQLDEWKKAMIQLQADNDYLRKTVARLKDQLNQCIIAGSTIPSSSPPSIQPSSSPSLTSPIAHPAGISTFSAPPHSSATAPIPASSSSSSSSSPTPDLSSGSFPMLNEAKRKPALSKREKKRQRLLADEKLYQNDDLEPIQLHCPLAMNNNPAIQHPMIKSEEPLLLDSCLSSSLPSSLVSSTVQPFFDLPMTTSLDPHDQYINFVDQDDDDDDDLPSSSSSSCSFSYPPTSLF